MHHTARTETDRDELPRRRSALEQELKNLLCAESMKRQNGTSDQLHERARWILEQFKEFNVTENDFSITGLRLGLVRQIAEDDLVDHIDAILDKFQRMNAADQNEKRIDYIRNMREKQQILRELQVPHAIVDRLRGRMQQLGVLYGVL